MDSTAFLHSVLRVSFLLPLAADGLIKGQLPSVLNTTETANTFSYWHQIIYEEQGGSSCIGTVHVNTVRCGVYIVLVSLVWAASFAILMLRVRSRVPMIRDAATSPTAPRPAGAFGQYLKAYGGDGPNPQASDEVTQQQDVGDSEAAIVDDDVEVDCSAHIQNAQVFFMCLVALTHCQKATGHWRWNDEVKEFINTWCSRGLAFLCGITAQDEPNKDNIRRILFYEATPLVLYCVFVEPLVMPAIDQTWYRSPTDVGHRIVNNLMYGTAGATWFIFALQFWRIWGWMLMAFRTPYRLPVALAVWVVAGYSPMESFKLGQAFSCFPLFAAGQLFPYTFVVRNVPLQAEGVALGVMSLIAVGAAGGTILGQALFRDLPSWGWASSNLLDAQIAHCGAGEAQLIWVRGMFRNVMEFSKTLVFVFLVCPRHRLFGITEAGAHLLCPYLLQYILTEIQNVAMKGSLNHLDVPDAAWIGIWAAEVALLLLLVVCLGSPFTRSVFSVLFEPRWVEHLVAGEDRGPAAIINGKAPFVSAPNSAKWASAS